MSAPRAAPPWIAHALVPALNLTVALVISGIIIAIIGESPVRALGALLRGALGFGEAVGFTLYYTTNFMFTGLAVAIAFHCGLFNIGGEGQAYIGGLGVGLVCLAMGGWPFPVVLVAAIAAAALFGGAWAYIPAYLQAKRGSHIVITTIMFNFIAAALMNYLLVEVLIKPGQQSPESRGFEPNTWLPYMHEILGWAGIAIDRSPFNLSFVLALACSVLVWGFIWHTRWGYEVRTVGQNQAAAVYAGISPSRNIILAMCFSGALAGFVGVNEIMGVHHRLMLDFTGGYGFVGIAVALMGRNHPFGIFLAALLFGVLYQGGAELTFEIPAITRDMVVVIQGLVILFSGALEHLFKTPLEALFARRAPPAAAE